MVIKGMAVAVGLLIGAGLASGDLSQPPSSSGPEGFEKVQARLMKAKGAVVSAACGSAASPWAYRGPRGQALEIKAYSQAEQSQAWSRDFVSTLLRSADWDSVQKFRGLSKPCEETHQVPLFTVKWGGGGDEIYALVSLDVRRAVLFEASRPLGVVDFKDRADSVFALIRQALAADSLVSAMSLPPLAEKPHDLPGVLVWVEKLPEVLTKVPPKYPPDAIEENLEGTIPVTVLVGTDGRVKDAYVAAPARRLHDLNDAAIDAVWQWKFAPAHSKGKPVAVWVSVPVRFSLR